MACVQRYSAGSERNCQKVRATVIERWSCKEEARWAPMKQVPINRSIIKSVKKTRMEAYLILLQELQLEQ